MLHTSDQLRVLDQGLTFLLLVLLGQQHYLVWYYPHHYQSIGLGNRTVCYMKLHDNFVRIYQPGIATRGNHSGFRV